jgi:hypothetical protein
MNNYDVPTFSGVIEDFVDKVYPRGFRGQFLCFGETQKLSRYLMSLGWTGVSVYSQIEPNYDIRPQEKVIVGEVGPDSHFVLTLDDYWVKAFTVKEIFNQFPGPYHLIFMSNTGRDRELWYTDSVQSALPASYILAEDGHNEDVIRLGIDRGYTPTRNDDYLFLRKVDE